MKFLTAAAAAILCGAVAFAADSPDIKKFSFSNNVEVYAIRDKDTTMKGSLFTDYTRASDLKQKDLKAEYPAAVNCFVLRYNFKTFLIDAGNFDEKGSLVTKLATINVRPKNVDYILLTHLHPDHVGGLIDKDGKAVFPNAKVYVTYEEWKYWSPIIAKQKPEEILYKFHNAYNGKIQTLSFGEPIVANLYAVKAVGHTPGHCFYRYSNIRFIGDLIHAVDLQVEHPEYCASFDNDKKQAYQTRVASLESLSKDGNLVFGAHIPFPGAGYIMKESGGFKFDPYKGK